MRMLCIEPMSRIFKIHLHRSINNLQISVLSTWYILIPSNLGYRLFILIPQNRTPHMFNSKEKLKHDSKSNERNLKQITVHLQIKNNENEQILYESKIDCPRIFSRCLNYSNGKNNLPKSFLILPYFQRVISGLIWIHKFQDIAIGS